MDADVPAAHPTASHPRSTHPRGARQPLAPLPPQSLPAELRASAVLFGLALLVTAGAASAAQAALRAVG